MSNTPNSPDINDELKKTLTAAQQFLREERQLFGDYFFTDSPMPRPKPKEPTSSQQTAVEQDIFGNTVSLVTAKGGKVREAVVPAYPREPWVNATGLDELNKMICDCTKCSLGHTRIKFVFGVGNPHADIMLIGEAPGADEDAQGEPFVGRAGQLLNKILEAIRFKREDVFICNILKCRPPNNRDPLQEEVDACEPHLWKQIELINPKLILCLGRISAQVLLKTNATLTELRTKVHNYRGIPMMVTYHPAALLRNPHWKRPTWEDVQKLRKMYDEMKTSKE
jgi:DNA polymerase